MVRRISGTGGLRRLLPAVLLAASLAAPATLTAQAAGEDAAGQGVASSPAAAPDPGVTTDPSPPATAETTPTAPPPATAPSSTTVPPPATTTRAESSASTSVSIVDFAFDPGAITVRVGDTVQWTNLGTAKEGHSASSAEFDSGILQTGGTYSFTFRQPGTFSYVCSTHPDMKGSVRVLAASTGASKPQGSGKKKSGSAGSSGGASALETHIHDS